MKTRILLADDHKLFRDGLRAMLEKHPHFQVIGEAENGLAVIELAGNLKPDIILMDISMPDLNGIEAARRILADNPNIHIIALSMHSDRRYVTEILKAGAHGYLLKDSAIEELITAIKTVMNNELYLSRNLSNAIIEEYLKTSRGRESGAFTILSPREREVLQLMAEGNSTKEIGARLNLSVKTIETHRKQIMDKLNLHSVAELTKYAIREGLTPLE